MPGKAHIARHSTGSQSIGRLCMTNLDIFTFELLSLIKQIHSSFFTKDYLVL